MLLDSYGNYIICDGAMGTMLQKSGLKPGERSDVMNATAPHVVENIHRMYVEAGSEIIYTNTLGANAHALSETGYTPEKIISAAISSAKLAADGRAKVALDIGPVGMLLEPIGDLEYSAAYELFKEQMIAGEKYGADLIIIETMSDITELKAAMLAATENTGLPFMATMTFDKTGRTYLGHTPEEFAETAERLGAVAVGLNCSLGPLEMIETAVRLAKATDLPLVIKPNAGLPDSMTGEYGIGPGDFAQQMAQLVNAVESATENASAKGNAKTRRKMIVGGCCGTSPDYIYKLKEVFST